MNKIRSPISYQGGKFRFLNKILPYIPKKKEYMSAFFGGGAIEYNLACLFKAKIHAFDLHPAIITFHKHFIEDPQRVSDLAKKLVFTVPYSTLKKQSVSYFKNVPPDTFESASLFYLFNKLSFNGTFGIREFKIENEQIIHRSGAIIDFDISPWDSLCKEIDITFSCQDFNVSLVQNKAFAILDPPYLQSEGVYTNKQNNIISCIFNHHQLNRILSKRKNWLCFYSLIEEVPYIQYAYEGFPYIEMHFKSSMYKQKAVAKQVVIFSKNIQKEVEQIAYARNDIFGILSPKEYNASPRQAQQMKLF